MRKRGGMQMPPLFSPFPWKNAARLLGKVELFSYPARQYLPRPGKFCRAIFSVPGWRQGRFS
jgi:hypothetical protein